MIRILDLRQFLWAAVIAVAAVPATVLSAPSAEAHDRDPRCAPASIVGTTPSRRVAARTGSVATPATTGSRPAAGKKTACGGGDGNDTLDGRPPTSASDANALSNDNSNDRLIGSNNFETELDESGLFGGEGFDRRIGGPGDDSFVNCEVVRQ